MKKFLSIILWLSLIILAGCGSQTEQIVQNNVYTIWVVTSLNGNWANLWIPRVQGMQLATEEINNNGWINWKKLEIVAQDDKFDPKETTAATQFLLSIKNPSVLTTLFEVATQAMWPLSKNSKVPMITACFSKWVLDTNPYAFKINFDAEKWCEQMIRHAKENSNYKKLGVLMSEVWYNQECMKWIKNVEPDVTEMWYTFWQKDFRTELMKLKEAWVDGIATVWIDFEYIAMFSQIAQLGYNTNFFCATASECIFNDELRGLAKAIDGSVYGVDFFDLNTLSNSEFAKQYKKKYQKADWTTLAYSAIWYDQTYMLREILKECEPADHTCIYEAMKNYDGSEGKTINTNGFSDRALNYNYDVYEFNKSKGGRSK